MRGHSVGGFGCVTTNKVIATIAGNVFGKDVQAYPKYGSEKKGLPTTYYLTIADTHINMHSELETSGAAVRQRPDGDAQPTDAEGAGAGRGDLHAVAVLRPERTCGSASRRRTRNDPRQEGPRLLLRHGPDRPRGGQRTRPADAHAGHRAAGRVPEADALRRRKPRCPTSRCTRVSRRRCRKYFGKRGDQVVQDNMTCIKRGYGEMKEIPAGVMGT